MSTHSASAASGVRSTASTDTVSSGGSGSSGSYVTGSDSAISDDRGHRRGSRSSSRRSSRPDESSGGGSAQVQPTATPEAAAVRPSRLVAKLLAQASDLKSLPSRPHMKVTSLHTLFKEKVAAGTVAPVKPPTPRGAASTTGRSRRISGGSTPRSARSTRTAAVAGLGQPLVSLVTQFDPACFNCGIEAHTPGSIRIIFDFYARYVPAQQQLGKRHLCYDDIKTANETMCFTELLQFCRDFRVLPQLMTRGDLLYIWQHEHISALNAVKALTYSQFKEFIVRMALLIYALPSRSRTNRPPREQVVSLCKYLKLNDIARVRSIIASTNAQRGAGLASAAHALHDATPLEVHDKDRAVDIRRNSMRLKATTALKAVNSRTKTELKQKMAQDIWNGNGDVQISMLDSPSALNISLPKSQYPAPAAAAVAAFGAESKESSAIAAEPQTPEKSPSKRSVSPLRSPLRSPSVSSLAPADSPKWFLRKQEACVNGAFAHTHGHGNVAQKSKSLKAFEPGLLAVIAPFETDASVVPWQFYDDLNLDMGRLRVGSKYRFRVQVTNSSRDVINVICKAHKLPGITITYTPKPIAPGLSCNILVEAKRKMPGETVGYIHVHATAIATGETETHKVPVYMRAVPADGPAAATADEPPVRPANRVTGRPMRGGSSLSGSHTASVAITRSGSRTRRSSSVIGDAAAVAASLASSKSTNKSRSRGKAGSRPASAASSRSRGAATAAALDRPHRPAPPDWASPPSVAAHQHSRSSARRHSDTEQLHMNSEVDVHTHSAVIGVHK